MKYRRESGDRVLVSLERGEDLRPCVQDLALTLGIGCAWLSAIGAIEDFTLGYYHLDKKAYRRRIFPHVWELASFQGNITMLDGKPFMHAHVTVGGPDFRAYCGHLFEAKVGVVVEMIMTRMDAPLRRIRCDEIGLARWEPDQ